MAMMHRLMSWWHRHDAVPARGEQHCRVEWGGWDDKLMDVYQYGEFPPRQAPLDTAKDVT